MIRLIDWLKMIKLIYNSLSTSRNKIRHQFNRFITTSSHKRKSEKLKTFTKNCDTTDSAAAPAYKMSSLSLWCLPPHPLICYQHCIYDAYHRTHWYVAAASCCAPADMVPPPLLLWCLLTSPLLLIWCRRCCDAAASVATIPPLVWCYRCLPQHPLIWFRRSGAQPLAGHKAGPTDKWDDRTT